METRNYSDYVHIYQPEGCVELYVGVREDGTDEYLHYVNGTLCSWEEIRGGWDRMFGGK